MQDKKNPVVIHCAPWLIPMAGPVVADGAVAVGGDVIVQVGSMTELVRKFPSCPVVHHSDCALMPPLVNAHIHLELSHLAHLGKKESPESFTGWITEMLAEREALGFVGSNVETAAQTLLQEQYESGVVALADIGNTGITQKLMSDFPGTLLAFLEYLGLGKASLVSGLKKLEKTDKQTSCTAHAPYSTHPELIKALKCRAEALGYIFPIHVAEPESERTMLGEGRGELVDFLKSRGFYDDAFQVAGIDNAGSVQYLYDLGVLNEKTLCVHAIHVTASEISLLGKSRAHVCLCPGSNRFLQVGTPPVTQYLLQGILPALGTDSASSNPELSIWREMQLLAEDHPDVAAYDILKMATVGGAAALGIEADHGTLEQGKKSRMLAVPIPQGEQSAGAVCAAIVQAGSTNVPGWITS